MTGALLDHVGRVLQAVGPAAGVAEPLRSPAVAATVSGAPSLTTRERDILAMLAQRYSNKEIAHELLIAPATVKKHTVGIYQKLNVHGRQQAVAKARTLGYLPAELRG